MKSISIKGTQTEKNLMKAFAGESQSMSRYKFFSKQAKQDSYAQIAAIFKAAAKNKLEHAKAFFSVLEGGKIEITAAFPAVMGDTLTNLREAAACEHEKWTELYPEYAKIAEEEGFTHIATIFHYIMAVNKIQDDLFAKLAVQLHDKTLFSSKEEEDWKCRKCGHRHHGKTPPKICPLCGSPLTFFQRICGCGCGCGCEK